VSENEAAIPAATILLLRDAPAFEVAMVTRHKNVSFAGGAMVFPGGRIDPGDAPDRWRARADGLNADPGLAAGQVAAIREAFEECGVLLARRAGDEAFLDAATATRLDPWRAASEADDARFLDMIVEEGLRLACDALFLFAHWIGPKGLHKRFDTLFFAAPTPPGQAIRQDGVEATEAVWTRPDAALDAAERGERKVIFPTARNLELLALSESIAAARDFAARRPIRRVEPQVVSRDGEMFLTIPADLGYPTTEEKLEAAMRG